MSNAENSARAPRVVGRPFERGRSGNPGGRPKAALDVQALAREHTTAAVQTLVEALKDPRHKVAAACALLDRGWGKATQPLAGDAENPVTYVIRGPAPVSDVEEWLRLHAPTTIDAAPEPTAAAEPPPPVSTSTDVWLGTQWLKRADGC